MEKFFQMTNGMWEMLFRVHDLISAVLMRFRREIQWLILILAHGSILIGIAMPGLRRNFGEAAGTLLIILLFLSPLSKIFRMKLLLLLMGFRRELGILMGYFAFVHGIGYILHGYDIERIFSVTDGSFIRLAPLFGFVAMILLLPLLLTSNRVSVQVFGIWWKRIHFLVYPAFVFVVLHRLFMPAYKGSDDLLFRGFQAIFLMGSYGMLKLLAWKNCFPPLDRFSRFVGDAYRRSGEQRAVGR